MIVTLQTQRVRTLEQVRVFIEGSEAVDFVGGDREGVYVLVRRTLVQLEYHHRLSKPDKGLVKRYLEKVTGLSRSQLTRLIGQHLRTGKIKDRRGKVPARPFERRYTQSDIRLLAKVDELLNRCRVWARERCCAASLRCMVMPDSRDWRGFPTDICTTCASRAPIAPCAGHGITRARVG